MEIKELFTVLLIAVIAIVVLFFGLYPVFKTTDKFLKKRVELENEIRTISDKDTQVIKLFELNKLSWCRSTGNYVETLAKMMEIKYNIKLLK